eukprot:gene26294-biopygen15611
MSRGGRSQPESSWNRSQSRSQDGSSSETGHCYSGIDDKMGLVKMFQSWNRARATLLVRFPLRNPLIRAHLFGSILRARTRGPRVFFEGGRRWVGRSWGGVHRDM